MKTFSLVLVLALAGCITTGYTYVKDPNVHKAWTATVVSIENQNIYNSEGAAWVGALAKVEAVGWKLSVVTKNGQHASFVQAATSDYTLTPGEAVYLIEDSGRIYAQPLNKALPAEVQLQP